MIADFNEIAKNNSKDTRYDNNLERVVSQNTQQYDDQFTKSYQNRQVANLT